MTELDEQGRPQPPAAADEAATLLGFLEYERTTLAWKCSGLDAVGLKTTLGPSSMTLGGMLRHLARVEDYWFCYALHARDAADAVEHRGLGGRPGPGLAVGRRALARATFRIWRDAVERSRALTRRH